MAKTCCAGERDKTVLFKFFSQKAKKVYLAGSFNNWDTTQFAAKKDTKGNWTVKVDLKPGKYEYKFFVDGSWVNDPEAKAIYNSFGTQNSSVEVK